jgi:hypothetical protein
LKNPDSLTARIMQAKYFPHTTIMDAALGNRPSLAWRSILAAKDLVYEGVLWRVGDRNDIKIWGDKWLPTPSSHSVQSPRIPMMEDMKVSSLIDQELKQWNNSFIASHFLLEEASVIINIPLGPFSPKGPAYMEMYEKWGIHGEKCLSSRHGEISKAKSRVFSI